MVTLHDLGCCTFPALLKHTLETFGDRPALSLVDGEPITYRQFQTMMDQVARVMTANGFAPGRKVAILGPGMSQWGAVYLATVCRGGIALPLLPDFTAGELENILRHAGVDMLVVSKSLYPKVEELGEDLLPVIIVMEDFTALRGRGANMSRGFLPKAVEVQEDDTASVIYTSGTTGQPKGVELSHRNLVWTALQCQTIHRVNKYDRCLSFLPLSHVYEFTIGFVLQILNGSCIYYLGRPPTVSSLLPAFQKVRPTIVLSVPMVMEKIYKNKIFPGLTGSKFRRFLHGLPLVGRLMELAAGRKLKGALGGKVRFFGIGGSRLDPDVELFLKRAGFPYAIGYGLTETSPLLAGSGPKHTVLGRVGPVLEGVELRILHPDPQTGVGEVVARGPNVMKGYYRDYKLTEAAFTTSRDSCGPGWFKTGDLGTLEDRRGRLWLSLKGRSKNMILGPSGENIYPEDIEFVLNQHPLVAESLVVEGEKGGLVALVKLAENAVANTATAVGSKLGQAVQDVKEDFLYRREELLSEIKFYVNKRVNKNARIGSIRPVEDFEKTASQKIKRYLYHLRPAHGGK
ncbi:MAG: AMP-binding protein [Spirochaetaceae bacterium]|nr:AMP-binding protein [Spirochaetaceae bacterium]